MNIKEPYNLFLKEFENVVVKAKETSPKKKWWEICHSLIQLGIMNPEECVPEDLDDDLSKEEQKVFNKKAHDIVIKHGIVTALRTVLRKDLKTTNAEDPGCGQISEKKYAKSLLENFLKRTPNEAWV